MSSNRSRTERAATLALIITLLLAAAKAAAWAATGSLAILSQALDSLVDIVALALVFLAVRISGRPADESHHYGHAKAENLVAFAQTLLVGAVLCAVIVEAARRLSGAPGMVDAPGAAIGIMVASLVIDGLRWRYLVGIAATEGSAALRAGALNIVADVGTATVALVSLLLVDRGFPRADAVGALAVSAGVLVAAVRLGKRSVDVLMDRAPDAPVEAIEAATTAAHGVAETRRVRVRESGNRLFTDVTVAAGRTTSLERAHDIAQDVEREIERVAPGTDVVVHVEPVAQTGELFERVQAAASRSEGVHEVHNVSVQAFDNADNRGLRVTLHAKVAPGLTLEEAHRLSDDVERAVAAELEQDVRVDTHIEPLEGTAAASDVTGLRDDIVSTFKSLACEEPDVVDCHEVLVSSAGAGLSVVAHVTGRGDLPLSRMHDASNRLEKAMHSAHSEIGQVLIHFEPASS